MPDLPDDAMDLTEAKALTEEGRFKGWEVCPFGSAYQLKAPKGYVLLRKFRDENGVFYHAVVNAFNADDDPNRALDELLQWMKEQKL